MEGILRRVYRDLQYGFVQVNQDSYFMHKADFDGDWGSLCTDFERGIPIYIEFNPTTTSKGLRAEDAKLSNV